MSAFTLASVPSSASTAGRTLLTGATTTATGNCVQHSKRINPLLKGGNALTGKMILIATLVKTFQCESVFSNVYNPANIMF